MHGTLSTAESTRINATPLTFRKALMIALLYGIAMAALALWVPQDHFRWMFSEEGPFEILSIGFWLLLATLYFGLPGVPRQAPYVPGVVAVFAAAREGDLHKAFTADSIFKSHYYLKMGAPLSEKLLAATFAAAAIGFTLYALIAGYRMIRRTDAWRLDWARSLIFGAALLFACKLGDRAESVLHESTGYVFPVLMHRFNAAFEEGYECLLPVIFIIALLQFQSRTLLNSFEQASTRRRLDEIDALPTAG